MDDKPDDKTMESWLKELYFYVGDSDSKEKIRRIPIFRICDLISLDEDRQFEPIELLDAVNKMRFPSERYYCMKLLEQVITSSSTKDKEKYRGLYDRAKITLMTKGELTWNDRRKIFDAVGKPTLHIFCQGEFLNPLTTRDNGVVEIDPKSINHRNIKPDSLSQRYNAL